MSVQDLDGTVAYSKHCTVTQDNKFEFPNRSHEQSEVEIYQCLMIIIIITMIIIIIRWRSTSA